MCSQYELLTADIPAAKLKCDIVDLGSLMGSGREQLTAQTMLDQVNNVVFLRFLTPSMPWLMLFLVQAALGYPSHLVSAGTYQGLINSLALQNLHCHLANPQGKVDRPS